MNSRLVPLAMGAIAHALLSLGVGTAKADIKVKFRGSTAVAIAHLANTKTCNSDTTATVVGHVIKREFANDGVRLQNFVYEKSDGSRGVINVDFDDIEKNEGMAGLSAPCSLSSSSQRLAVDFVPMYSCAARRGAL